MIETLGKESTIKTVINFVFSSDKKGPMTGWVMTHKYVNIYLKFPTIKTNLSCSFSILFFYQARNLSVY